MVVLRGGSTHVTWPVNEDYCRTMLPLHWPSWFDIQEVKGEAESWIDRFKDFFASDDCPTFVKAKLLRHGVMQTTHKNRYLKRMRKMMLSKQKNNQTGWMYMRGRTKYMRV